MTVTPTFGPAGSTAVVSGSGFQSGERVELVIGRTILSRPRTDSRGVFTGERFTVPSVIGRATSFEIVGAGEDSGRVAKVTFRLT